MTPAFANLYHAVHLVQSVKSRLTEQGAVRELDAVDRMSVDELDLLVRLERGSR